MPPAIIKRKVSSFKFQVLIGIAWVPIFLMGLAAIFLSSCCAVQAAEPPRYEITAAVDVKTHTIQATQKVVFTNNSDKQIQEIYFHIYPHRFYTEKEKRFMYRYAGYFKINPFPEGFQGGDLQVEAVSSLGEKLTYIIEGKDRTILKVELDAPLEPRQSKELLLDFKVVIPHAYGKFGWHKDIITLVRWYPILSVLDKEGWHNYPFYIYHQPYYSDASYYTVTLTVPKGAQVAATGTLIETTLDTDRTKTLTFNTEAPVRDFSLGMSEHFAVVSRDEGTYKINAYYSAGDQRQAERALTVAAELMRFYGRRFGEYPYKEFNIIPSYLGYGGVQSSGNLFLDTRAYRLPGFLHRHFTFLVAHETGHQWFYNLIGSDEYKEMFLDEGVNSYWLLQYLEQKFGQDALVLDLPKSVRWLIPNFSFRDSTIARYLYLAKNSLDRPIIGELSSFQEPSSIFALTYGKGAAVLEMLKRHVGENTFLRIMGRYAKEYRFSNARLDDLLRISNEEAGQDLGPFFYQWLNTKYTCDYAIKKVTKKNIVLTNYGEITLPVETRIQYKDGSEEIALWDGTEGEKSISISDKKKIERIAIDPQNKIVLDLDLTNNTWPRQHKLSLVPLYFFAYDIPVVLPRQSYNMVAGPSVGGSSLGAAGSLQKPYDGILKFSSVYDFNGQAVESRIGYEIQHVGKKQTAIGFELFDYQADDDKDDVTGGKFYLRRELWPASYGIFDGNDHVSLYLIRDRKLDTTSYLNGKEDARNTHYRKKDEAIVGITGSFGRYGPYPDPDFGWKITPLQEFAGHFLGGEQSFFRSSLELDRYYLLFPKQQHKIAGRLKVGWGESSDKSLFQLGGADGLRGYSRKTIEGAHMMLAAFEYRMPLIPEIRWHFLGNIMCLDKIQLVGFSDIGKAWYADFSGSDFKKDVGLGVRFHFDIAGFLEKMVVRLDVAQALNEPKEEPHVWFGLSHAF